MSDCPLKWFAEMDILTNVLNRVRLSGTLLFHYELGRPWSLALPEFPDAVFHYLSRGSAIVVLQDGRTLSMAGGDFVVITRGDSHVLCSDRTTKPFPLLGSRHGAWPTAQSMSLTAPHWRQTAWWWLSAVRVS